MAARAAPTIRQANGQNSSEFPCGSLRLTGKNWGDRAVFRLNDEMLCKAPPDLVLAFPGGDVTADMLDKAENAGIRLVIAAPS